jgi:hypothetical protein
MSVFTQYTPKIIKKLNRKEFADLIAMAEVVKGIPFEIKTESDEEKEKKDKRRVLSSIEKEARINEQLSFREENEELSRYM